MKKESIIVGIFGLSLGLLVAWAIWNFKSSAPQPENLTLSPSPVVTSIAPSPTSTPSFSLTLDTPQDETLATESSILVSGRTKSQALVVISTNSNDYALTVSQDGSFSQEVDLEEGENILTVTSYDQSQKAETVEKVVVYVKESS